MSNGRFRKKPLKKKAEQPPIEPLVSKTEAPEANAGEPLLQRDDLPEDVQSLLTPQAMRQKVTWADIRPKLSPRAILHETKKLYRDIAETKYGAGPFLIIMLVVYIQSFDNQIIARVGPELRLEFGTSLSRMAVVGSIVGLLLLPAAPLIGFLSDRVSRRRMVAASAVFSGACTLATTFTHNFTWFAGLRGLNSLSEQLGGVALSTMQIDYYPVEARGKVAAFRQVAFTLPGILTGVTIALLVTRFGWRGPVRVVGPFLVIAGLVAAWKLKDPVRGYWERRRLGAREEVAATPEPPVGWSETIRTMLSVRTLRRTLIAGPIISFGLSGFALLPFYLQERFGLNPFERSLIGIPTDIVEVFAIIVGGAMADRLVRRRPGRLIMFAAIVTGVGVGANILIVLIPSITLVVVSGMVLSIANTFLAPALFVVSSLVIPPRIRGGAIGFFSLLVIPQLLFQPLAPYLADTYGLQVGMVALTPIALIGLFIYASAAPMFEIDMRAAIASANAHNIYSKAKEEGKIKLLLSRDLDVHYGSVQVLFNVDLTVDEGETLALLGTNGAGKSTLLKAVSGIQPASNGAVLFDGRDITRLPPHEIARLGVVHMPGGRAIFPTLTVRKHLEMAVEKLEHEEGSQRIGEALEYFPKLAELLDKQAGLLSGGEQQMVSLSQAFLSRPRLLMIDELSLGLAPTVVQELIEIIRIMKESGITIILVEQSVNIALTVADRAVFMEKGEIKFDGATKDLLRRPDIMRAIYLKGSSGLAAESAEAKKMALQARNRGERRAVLELEGITKTFGGITAVDNVSLSFNEGDAIGFIGPNGAGKTTLFDIISGYQPADEGRVIYDGVDVTKLDAAERARLKLIRRFQEGRLFPALTVFEAISVALDQRLEIKNTFVHALQVPAVRKAESIIKARAERLIDLLELHQYRDKFVGELSTGLKRIVDLACVLAAEPRVLLLDEPSSGIAQVEAEGLVPLLRRVRYETGCTLLIIEHDIPLLTKVTDELVAMVQGEIVVRGISDDVLSHETVVQAYLGTDEAAMRRSGVIT